MSFGSSRINGTFNRRVIKCSLIVNDARVYIYIYLFCISIYVYIYICACLCECKYITCNLYIKYAHLHNIKYRPIIRIIISIL